MRTFKTCVLAIALAFSGIVSANTTEPKVEPTSISFEVSKLLKNPHFSIENDLQVYVHLVFNESNEMVVLSIDSGNELIDSYIKNRLNYKKLAEKVTDKDKTYIVPVRITPNE